jgi:hypothetical protein
MDAILRTGHLLEGGVVAFTGEVGTVDGEVAGEGGQE